MTVCVFVAMYFSAASWRKWPILLHKCDSHPVPTDPSGQSCCKCQLKNSSQSLLSFCSIDHRDKTDEPSISPSAMPRTTKKLFKILVPAAASITACACFLPPLFTSTKHLSLFQANNVEKFLTEQPWSMIIEVH